MANEQQRETWEIVEAMIRVPDPAGLREYLGALPPGETARVLSRLNPGDRESVLTLQPPQQAAELVVELPNTQAIELLSALPPTQAASILNYVSKDVLADILGEFDADQSAAILANLAPEVAEDVRRLAQYSPNTAGGLMIAEYLVYPDSSRVEDIIADLRRNAGRYSRYQVQYAYITSPRDELVGVLRLRDLLLAQPEVAVRSIMVADPLRLKPGDRLDELGRFFDRYPFFGAPVSDAEGRLLGVVLRADAEEAIGERAERRFLLANGVLGGEEFRSMPWRVRLARRLIWLAISMGLSLLGASIIGLYEQTLASAIALAAFLPVISGMGGNSGNQALAVSVRELALGLIQPRELWWVLRKEAGIGIINGLLLGTALGILAFVWKGNPYLGLVVGAAITLNTLVAACLGGIVPLALRRLDLDPAVATAPVLMTFNDMCGFFFALSLANVLLHHLTP